jgi:membrane associated rhomboid family serine protease
MVRYLLIAVLVILQAAVGIPALLQGDGQYWCRALSYSFFHANWWHLAVNSLAIWSVYRRCKPCRDLVFPFLIAVLVYPLSFRPVIGFSNVIYATIGMRTPPLSSPWWKRTEVIVFLAVTVLLIFIPRFSATTHIAAFALGMAGASVNRFFQTLTKDARRYL